MATSLFYLSIFFSAVFKIETWICFQNAHNFPISWQYFSCAQSISNIANRNQNALGLVNGWYINNISSCHGIKSQCIKFMEKISVRVLQINTLGLGKKHPRYCTEKAKGLVFNHVKNSSFILVREQYRSITLNLPHEVKMQYLQI